MSTKWTPEQVEKLKTCRRLLDEVFNTTIPAPSLEIITSYVGIEGDPIRVQFDRTGAEVKMSVIYTDEMLRGIGVLFTHMDGFQLCSVEGPVAYREQLYVHGTERARDSVLDRQIFSSERDAVAWLERALAALDAFNAWWRAQKNSMLVSSPSSVRTVGNRKDPLRVRFERCGLTVIYTCLHTDRRLRGKGHVYTHKEFRLTSTSSPRCYITGLEVHGTLIEQDAISSSITLASLTETIAWIERATEAVTSFNAHESTTPIVQVSRVGGIGDPICIQFELKNAEVITQVIHTDDSLRGKGLLYTYKNAVSLASAKCPSARRACVHVWGLRTDADNSRCKIVFPSSQDATQWIMRVSLAVSAFNARWGAGRIEARLDAFVEVLRKLVNQVGEQDSDVTKAREALTYLAAAARSNAAATNSEDGV